MIYENTVKGIFVERPNRFIAKVLINGTEETVHVKNTGRCKELLIKGVTVILEIASNPNRKTKYDLIAVYKNSMLINMDSQVPNAVVAQALSLGKIKEIGDVDFIKREVTHNDSRYDIYYEKGNKKGFIEVKGVTLENDGIAMFPDAPTERGTKHVNGLISALKEDFETSVLFLVQMKGVHKFTPNYMTDSKFSEALKNAKNSGVKILVYDSVVKENSISLGKKIPFEL